MARRFVSSAMVAAGSCLGAAGFAQQRVTEPPVAGPSVTGPSLTAPPAAQSRATPRPLGPPDGSFVQGLIGFGPMLRRAEHRELSDVFAERELSRPSSNLLSFGMLVEGSVARFRISFSWDFLSAEQELSRGPDSAELVVPVSQRQLALGLGYDLVQTHGFALFPSVGFAAGDVTLQYAPDDPLWEDKSLRPDPDSDKAIQPIELTRGFNALDLGLGFEQVIPFTERPAGARRPRFGVALALRLGYRFQLSDTAWTYRDKDESIVTLETGPGLDGAGPYVQWVLGIGLSE